MKTPTHPQPKKSKNPKTTAVEYQQQIGELTAHLQSLQAEFENYKKRQVAEQAALMDNAKIAVLTELLPALDNFDRAATHLPADLEDNAWAKGMQYVGQQLLTILEEMGIDKITPQVGEVFDHNLHDAIDTVLRDDIPPGSVVEVINPGYKLNERVIRPAIVKVSKDTTSEALNQSEPISQELTEDHKKDTNNKEK